MLAFVTSLRHPQNSADYSRVESLLADTLRSVLHQTSPDFVVIVVGNVEPTVPLPERVHFVRVDFGPPAPPDGPRTAREPFVRDKGTKIGVGLLYARRFDPDFVMIFDADDFVHRSIAEIASRDASAPGWVIDRGYALSRVRHAYQRQDEFNKTCGTCLVVPAAAYDVPTALGVDATQEQVVEAFGDTLWRALGAHRDAVEWFASRGVHLRPFPLRGAIYHVDTGENHSGKQLGGVARPVTRGFAREFGLEPSGVTPRALWQACGPWPVAQSLRARARSLRGTLRRG